MRKAYAEVLKSYWRRSLSSWALAILVLAGVFQILMSVVSRGRDTMGELTMFMAGMLLVASFLWFHFREQIVNPYHSLWPGYVGPQVVAFCTYWLALVIIWPGILSLSGTANWLALAAVAGAVFGCLGLCVWTLSVVLSFLGLGFWFWVTFGLDGDLIKPFLSGSHPALAVGVFFAATGVAVLAAFRMLRLTEEDSIYHRKLQLDTSSTRPRMTGEVNRAWSETRKSQPLGWPSLRTSVFIPATSSVWGRARRWRTLTSGLIKSSSLVTGTMVVSFLLPWRGNPTHFSSGVSPSLVIVAMLLNLMPAVSVAQMWLNQWRFLETELLRPVDRRGFFRELGLAMAIDMVQCWAIAAVAIIIGVTVLLGASIDLPGLAFTILASSLLLVLEFGVVISLMSCRSPVVGLLGCLGMMIFIIPIILCSYAPNLGPYRLIALAVALVLAVLGIFVIQIAHRTWMETELG